MNVSIIVATYGTVEWADRGGATADASRQHEVDSIIHTHLHDGTLAEARNTAAGGCEADWLCFLDADDELDPGYFPAMRAAHTRGWDPEYPIGPRHPALLVPSLQRVHPDCCTTEPPAIPDWDRLLIDLNCAVIGTLVPRVLFLEVGGFREWSAYEDWDLWLRCVRAGARLLPVPRAVYRGHVNPSGRNLADHATRSRTYEEIRSEHADVEPGWWRNAKVQP